MNSSETFFFYTELCTGIIFSRATNYLLRRSSSRVPKTERPVIFPCGSALSKNLGRNMQVWKRNGAATGCRAKFFSRPGRAVITVRSRAFHGSFSRWAWRCANVLAGLRSDSQYVPFSSSLLHFFSVFVYDVLYCGLRKELSNFKIG